MGDGECAVLVSQHPSTKFNGFHTNQGRFIGHGSQHIRDRYAESQHTLPLYFSSCFSWPSVRLHEMDCERKQDIGAIFNADDSTNRGSATVRHVSQLQEAQTGVLSPNYLELEDFSPDHSSQTGRDAGEITFEHLMNQLPSASELELAAIETSVPYWTDAGSTVEGKDINISFQEQHRARISGLALTELRTCSAARDLRAGGGKAPNENVHIQSHICASLDSNHKSYDTWHHHSEKNSRGSKQHYQSIDKFHGVKVSSGHFGDFYRFGASNIHGKDHDMNGFIRSYDRDSESDYQERNYADGSGLRYNAFDGQCSSAHSYDIHVGRTSASAYESRYQVRENGRPEFDGCKRYSRDTEEWEGRVSFEKQMDYSQGCNQLWIPHGRNYREEARLVIQNAAEHATAYDTDELGLAARGVSMGLPLVLEKVSERKYEAHPSYQKFDASQHAEIFHGPSQLDVLGQRLEDGSQHIDHIGKHNGSDVQIMLKQAVCQVPTCSRPTLAVSSQDLPVIKQAVLSEPFCHNVREEQSNVTFDQTPLFDDLRINERVQRLMDGFILVPGKEKEVISEALSHATSRVLEDNDIDLDNEESPRSRTCLDPYWRDDQLSYRTSIYGSLQIGLQDLEQSAVVAIPNQIGGHSNGFQNAGKWTSRGGDWKLVWQSGTASARGTQANAHVDSVSRLKTVLNKNYPLCELKHSGMIDPRREHIKFKALDSRKLELRQWSDMRSEYVPEYIPEYVPEAVKALETQSQCYQPFVATTDSQASTPFSLLACHLQTSFGSAEDLRNIEPGVVMPSGRLTCEQAECNCLGPLLTDSSLLKCNSESDHRALIRARGFAVEKQAPDTETDSSVGVSACPLNKSETTISCEILVKEPPGKEDLKLHDGEWYYMDGTGHEEGPFSYVQLQLMVDTGSIYGGITVYRKSDKMWCSLYSKHLHSQQLSQLDENQQLNQQSTLCNINDSFSFHQFYPQFIRYIHGKLHEHVMKLYKSRDFAAILHEGVDKKLNDKKHESAFQGSSLTTLALLGVTCDPLQISSNFSSDMSLDTRPDAYNRKWKNTEIMDYSSPAFCSPGSSSSRCEQNVHAETVDIDYSDQPKHCHIHKKKRLVDVETSDDAGLQQTCHSSCTSNDVKGIINSVESDLETGSKKCLNSADFDNGIIYSLESDLKTGIEKCLNSPDFEKRSWMLLDPHILASVFHCLSDDVRSLVVASTTCKSWRTCFENFIKDVRYIDLSSLGSLCTDAVLKSVAGSARQQIRRLLLRHCTAISPSALRSLLKQCPNMSLVDISGCELLKGLAREFHYIKWICCGVRVPRQKIKSLKLICERVLSSNKVMEDQLLTNSSNYLAQEDKLVDEQAYSEDTESMELGSSCFVDQDSETTQIAPPIYDSKHSRLNLGGKLKEGSDSCPKIADRVYSIADMDLGGMPRQERKNKQELGAKVRATTNTCFPADKIAPCKSKVDLLITKGSCSSDTFKSAEKYIYHQMAQILKTVKEADAKKFFSKQVLYGKGLISLSGRVLDFSAIEEKWKAHHYHGTMDGLNSFKNDLFLLFRNPFHSRQKGSSIFTDAEDIFKLARHLVKKLEETVRKVHTERCLSAVGSNIFKENLQYNQSVTGSFQNVERQTYLKRKSRMNESSVDVENEDNHLDEEADGCFRRKKLQKSWKMSTLEDEEDTDESEPDIETGSEWENTTACENGDSSTDECSCSDMSNRQWGARMTKASMVPPVARKYDVIDKYVPVIDEEEVMKKMKLELPEDYREKLQSVSGEYSHLEIPEFKDYKPRKTLGDEVLEQEVYGIDPYTYNLLLDTMATDRPDFTDSKRQQLIEEDLLRALNEEVKKTTGTGKIRMTYPLELVVQRLVGEAKDRSTKNFCQSLLRNMTSRQKERYVAYRKGLGVVCNKKDGFEKDDFVVEFFGEVYPAWRWYEKQDAIRLIQKKEKDPVPEFYNIFLERPKGDDAGYDLVVVDAMHRANYASRICHSCWPNCEAKVTAVDGQYQIGLYTLRPIQYGEELTFDYNSVTESKEEYEASVCLCGSQRCRGSYLHLAGPETFQQVIKEKHGILDRHHLLLEACYAGPPTRIDMHDLRQAGLGSCLLEGLPDWTVCYAARLVRFINQERNWLPKEIIKNFVKERQLDTYYDQELSEAEVQADGVYNQRIQNLAITLDKVRYVLRKVYGDPGMAPPPLRKLEPAEVASLIWKSENSVVGELLCSMENHLSKDDFVKFKCKVREHEPVDSGNVKENIQESLMWLRDELRKVPVTCFSRHDAAADIIHMYAYTRIFFTNQDYKSFQSPPISINSLDLGPKHAHLLGSDSHEWKKTYGKDYVLGQLIFWYKQNVADPGSSLAKAQRGCLVLPDVSSCYAKSLNQDPRIAYGSRMRRDMLHRMEQQPQKQWPKQDFWEFKNKQRLFGSPMMDTVKYKSSVNSEMIGWLKCRPKGFKSPWDHFA